MLGSTLVALACLAFAPQELEPDQPVAAAEGESSNSALEVAPFAERMLRPLNWKRVDQRESVITFPPSAARAAAADLEGHVTDPVRRAAALMALGATRLPGGRERLEAWALGGSPLERRAAVLALGELGSSSLSTLRPLSTAEDSLVAETALLAMLRLESPAVRAEVEALAADTSKSTAQVAKRLLAFLGRPTGGPGAPDSVKLLFELRWEAAIRYGLVGGKSWSQVRIEELQSDPTFLEAVVLRSVVRSSLPGVKDHVLAMLEAGGGPEVVRASVHALPLHIGRRVAAGEWIPADLREWEMALDALEARGAPREGFEIARAALGIKELRVRAAALMLAMGDETAPSVVVDVLFSGALEQRIALVRALGRSRDSRWVEELKKLRSESSEALRMAALIAQMRMGYRASDEIIRSIVTSGDDDRRAALVGELLAVQTDARVIPLLEAAQVKLSGRLRLEVAAALASTGRVLPRRELHEALETGLEPDLAPLFVRALSNNPSHEDVALVARLFPSGKRDLDIELGCVLATNNHPLGMSILERALWTSTFDQSVLAAGLIFRARGIGALHLELDSPPPRVTQTDLRTVGFALGEWGGVEALEELARRRTSSDPALGGALLGAMSARTQ